MKGGGVGVKPLAGTTGVFRVKHWKLENGGTLQWRTTALFTVPLVVETDGKGALADTDIAEEGLLTGVSCCPGDGIRMP